MRHALDRLLWTIRRVLGAPDYTAYLRHMRTHHPDCVPLSESAFRDERLEARYSRPGTRCC